MDYNGVGVLRAPPPPLSSEQEKTSEFPTLLCGLTLLLPSSLLLTCYGKD